MAPACALAVADADGAAPAVAPACALAVADADGAAPAGRTSAVHSYVVPVRAAGALWRLQCGMVASSHTLRGNSARAVDAGSEWLHCAEIDKSR